MRLCCCSWVTLAMSFLGTLAGLRFRLPYAPSSGELSDVWVRITTSNVSPGPLSPCRSLASWSSDLAWVPGGPSRPGVFLATSRPSLIWCAAAVRVLFCRPLPICWTRKKPSTVATTTQMTRVVATTRSCSERCQRRRSRQASSRARRCPARIAERACGGSAAGPPHQQGQPAATPALARCLAAARYPLHDPSPRCWEASAHRIAAGRSLLRQALPCSPRRVLSPRSPGAPGPSRSSRGAAARAR